MTTSGYRGHLVRQTNLLPRGMGNVFNGACALAAWRTLMTTSRCRADGRIVSTTTTTTTTTTDDFIQIPEACLDIFGTFARVRRCAKSLLRRRSLLLDIFLLLLEVLQRLIFLLLLQRSIVLTLQRLPIPLLVVFQRLPLLLAVLQHPRAWSTAACVPAPIS